MNGCLDSDTLVALNEALDWKAEDALRHVMACDDCQAQLRRLATLHGVLNDQLAPPPGFAERVVLGLQLSEQIIPSVRRWPFIGLLNAVLAGVTTFFAVALSAGGTSPVTLGAPVILVSVAVATATVWWSQAYGAAAARSQ
ncbi:MAG: hypothetical protein IIA55_08810 [Gemmatimonadetes bacterium]|nr:hypothetical protein [Gemmatimonadota bacterium]